MSLSTSNIPLAIQTSAISKLRSRMEALQSEISSGSKEKVGVNLGIRSSALIDTHQKSTAISGYQSNINVLKIQMTSATDALDHLNTKVEAFRNALLQYQGGAGTQADVQQAAKSLLEELPTIFGNATGGANLFSGQSGKTEALDSYYAQGSQSKTDFDQAAIQQFGFDPSANPATGLTATDMSDFLANRIQAYSDTQAWSQLWTGDAMSALKIPIAEGKTVALPTLTDMPALRSITAVAVTLSEAGTWKLNEGSFAALVSGGLSEMSKAQTSLTNERTRLGEMTNLVTETEKQNESTASTLQEYISGQENVDQYAAMTELTEIKSRLEVSYQITSSLADLLLAKYLR